MLLKDEGGYSKVDFYFKNEPRISMKIRDPIKYYWPPTPYNVFMGVSGSSPTEYKNMHNLFVRLNTWLDNDLQPLNDSLKCLLYKGDGTHSGPFERCEEGSLQINPTEKEIVILPPKFPS